MLTEKQTGMALLISDKAKEILWIFDKSFPIGGKLLTHIQRSSANPKEKKPEESTQRCIKINLPRTSDKDQALIPHQILPSKTTLARRSGQGQRLTYGVKSYQRFSAQANRNEMTQGGPAARCRHTSQVQGGASEESCARKGRIQILQEKYLSSGRFKQICGLELEDRNI